MDSLNLTVEQKENLGGISLEPSNENKRFVTLDVNGDNLVNGEGAWNRICDSEFKILNEIALELGDNTDIGGSIKIYSDLACCPSCKGVIKQFKEKYPNISIEVIYKTTGGD